MTRGEWEYEIPLADADQLLSELCERPLIEKIRTRIFTKAWCGKSTNFFGDNLGLIVAEIELESEDQSFA